MFRSQSLLGAFLVYAVCGCQPSKDTEPLVPPAPRPTADVEKSQAEASEVSPVMLEPMVQENEPSVQSENESSLSEVAISSTEPNIDESESTQIVSQTSTTNKQEPTVKTNSVEAKPAQTLPAYRLLLPTTSGALVVGVDILVDELPLQSAFSQRVESILEEASEGEELTWPKLFKHLSDNPAIFGSASRLNESQYRGMIQRYDKNQNKKPEQEEATRLLFRDAKVNGPFRLVGTDSYRQINRTQSATFVALNPNSDGILEPSEINSAFESLQRLDENADQRIDRSEISVSDIDDSLAWNARRSTRWGEVAMDLSGYVDWSMLAYTLAEMPGVGPFGDQPNAIGQLTHDRGSSFNSHDAKQILNIDPDLRLSVRYSNTGESPKISITSMSESLEASTTQTETHDQVRIQSDSFRLIVDVVENRATVNTIPPQVFQMLDANNDGGLEESEIPEPAREQYSIEDFDQNGDEKLTLQEIMEGMQPESSIWDVQVRGRAAEVPDGVFAWLDENHDGFLSTREMTQSTDRLRALGHNIKNLKATDLPDAYFVRFGRGEPNRDAGLFTQIKNMQEKLDTSAPLWAQSMDFNRDGDISRHEFPGQTAQFEELDRNHDGFLDHQEVQSGVSASQDPDS